MKQWLQYTERLSFLMSQGTHVCDIALMYPTESMQAYPDASTKMAFEQAMKLSNSGLDYDFMDYRSLQKSKVENGCLNISGEKYRILILVLASAYFHLLYGFYKPAVSCNRTL